MGRCQLKAAQFFLIKSFVARFFTVPSRHHLRHKLADGLRLMFSRSSFESISPLKPIRPGNFHLPLIVGL